MPAEPDEPGRRTRRRIVRTQVLQAARVVTRAALDLPVRGEIRRRPHGGASDHPDDDNNDNDRSDADGGRECDLRTPRGRACGSVVTGTYGARRYRAWQVAPARPSTWDGRVNRLPPSAAGAGCSASFRRLVDGVERVIQGKHDVVRLAAICLLAEGHLLLEDVPGTGKTTLARAFAAAVDVGWGRVQFTPDVLPSDVTGSTFFNRETSKFEFRHGPVFNSFVIADELNRASPKTQSALLQVMEERTVMGLDGPEKVPLPFMVIATQNPQTMVGTYPLPEAQLDRFLLRTKMDYPDEPEDETDIIRKHRVRMDIESLERVLTPGDVIDMIESTRKVFLGGNIERYIVDLARATRNDRNVELGVSPRGCVATARAAAALAAA